MSQKNKKYDAYSLADLFREMELELLASASRTLAKHEAWEKEEGFKWEQWQLAKLRSLQQYQVNNRKIIKSYKSEMRSIINDVIKTTYSEAYQESLKIAQEVEDVLDIDMGSAVDLLEDFELPEENFFHINDVKVDAIIQEMSITFDRSESLIMRKMNDSYRETLEKSVLKLGAGVTDVKKAVDEATQEFLNKGIDCITYKNGRRVNIASYAEMYLRTANQQATFYAQGKARDIIGVYTVLMSQHENCSPMCLPYQGTVMIDDVFTALNHDDAVQMARETGYTRLATAIENHAFHPNCRHSLSTWYPGKSSIPEPFTKEQNEAAVNRYNLEQEQRRLENNLRKWRRVEAGSVDKENRDIATQMVEKSRQELRNHVKENPNLRRNYWRERVEKTLGAEYPFIQDEKQYNRYRDLLRESDMPSLEEFSAIKQTRSKDYELIKTKAKAMGYYNRAVKHEIEFTSLVKDVANQTDMKVVGLESSVKSIDSYLRKVEANFLDGKISYEVKDINRYTLTSNVESLTDKTLNSFDIIREKGYNISEVKNYWLDTKSAYNGVNVVVRRADGIPFEIQYHTPQSFYFKENELHSLYEIWRSLDPSSDEAKKISKKMFELSKPVIKPKGIDKVRNIK